MNIMTNVKYFFAHSVMARYIILAVSIITYGQARSSNAQENPFNEFARGDSLGLTLRAAVFLSLERNPTVSIQRINPIMARTYYNEQREAFDPELKVEFNQSQTKLQRFLGARPNPIEMTWDRSNYSAGIIENLPTGTSISADVSMSGSVSSLYSDQFSGIAGVTITQSLLNGFGLGVNLANLRKSAIDTEISQYELKAVAEQVVANVEKAYWNLYLAFEEINIHNESLDLANRQLQESTERVAVGKLSELELAAVHAEVATRREALIDAQSRLAQGRLEFLYLINPPDESLWTISPVLLDRPFVPVDTLDVITVHEQLGMQYRPDLRQARLTLEKGELDVVQTKNGLLPQLDFFITFNRTTYAKTFNAALPDVQSPFFDANAGLSFSLPMTKRSARAQYARAKRSREQSELSLENMERMVQMDVRSAYIEVLRSKQQIGATRVTRVLQEQKLNAEQEKFRVGKSTNYLVLQAQRDFTASQLDEVRSMVLYLNALVDLYQMEGTLLDRRGINSFIE